MPRESIEILLESVDGLISAEVEERCIFVNLPLGRVALSAAVIVLVIITHNINFAELGHFVEVLHGPESRNHQIC